MQPLPEKERLVLKEFPRGNKITGATKDTESSPEFYLENRPCWHYFEESRGQGVVGLKLGLEDTGGISLNGDKKRRAF